MPERYCPIIFTYEAMGKSEELVKCKGDKCAWYFKEIIPSQPKNKVIEMCGILWIAKNISPISKSISDSAGSLSRAIHTIRR